MTANCRNSALEESPAGCAQSQCSKHLCKTVQHTFSWQIRISWPGLPKGLCDLAELRHCVNKKLIINLLTRQLLVHLHDGRKGLACDAARQGTLHLQLILAAWGMQELSCLCDFRRTCLLQCAGEIAPGTEVPQVLQHLLVVRSIYGDRH